MNAPRRLQREVTDGAHAVGNHDIPVTLRVYRFLTRHGPTRAENARPLVFDEDRECSRVGERRPVRPVVRHDGLVEVRTGQRVRRYRRKLARQSVGGVGDAVLEEQLRRAIRECDEGAVRSEHPEGLLRRYVRRTVPGGHLHGDGRIGGVAAVHECDRPRCAHGHVCRCRVREDLVEAVCRAQARLPVVAVVVRQRDKRREVGRAHGLRPRDAVSR